MTELVTLEVTIEARDDHDFPLVSHLIYDFWQPFAKELGFIDPDNVGLCELLPLENSVVESLSDELRLVLDHVVSDHAEFAALIAHVTAMLDKEYSFARDLLPSEPPQQLRALPREHGPHDEFDAAASRDLLHRHGMAVTRVVNDYLRVAVLLIF